MPEYEIKEAHKSGDLEKVNKGFEILKKTAASGDNISLSYYSDFYKMLSAPGEEVLPAVGSRILADISIYTQKTYGHMLTAIIISKESNKLLGEGFYTLAKEIGALKKDASEKEKEAFWVDELKKIKDYWAKHYKNSI